MNCFPLYSIHSKCHKTFLFHCCDPWRIKNVIKKIKPNEFPSTFGWAVHETNNIKNTDGKIGKRQLFLTWISFFYMRLCFCDGFLWYLVHYVQFSGNMNVLEKHVYVQCWIHTWVVNYADGLWANAQNMPEQTLHLWIIYDFPSSHL